MPHRAWTIALAVTASTLAASVAAAGEQAGSIPAGYELAYRQDFQTAESLEEFRFSEPGAFRWIGEDGKAGGVLEMHGGSDYKPPHRSPRKLAMIAGRKFGSFVLQAKLKQTGREYGHRDLCVFFGFQDPGHYYYAHVATKTDPHAHNIFIVDGAARRKISDTTTEGFDWGEDRWHTLRLVRDAEAGTIKLFMNDWSEPVMTATDRSFGAGWIGFGSFDDVGRFDAVRIWTPDGDSAAKPLKALKPKE